MPDHFEGWLNVELHRQLSAIRPFSVRPGQARYQAVMLRRRPRLFSGAYAAGTITVHNPRSFQLGSGPNTLTLIPLNGAAPIKSSDLPNWTNVGQCVSFFAKNRNYALAPSGTLPSTLTLRKSYHGNLVSFVASTWCKTQVATSPTAARPTSQPGPATAPDTNRTGPPPGLTGTTPPTPVTAMLTDPAPAVVIRIDNKDYRVQSDSMTGAQLRSLPSTPIHAELDLYHAASVGDILIENEMVYPLKGRLGLLYGALLLELTEPPKGHLLRRSASRR